MKHLLLIFGLLLPVCTFSQFKESFSGVEITSDNPWEGAVDLFTINPAGQLEFVSPSGEAGEAALSIPLNYSGRMSWELDVSVDFKTTNSNNARIHVYTDDDVSYYIQIGNNTNQISLYAKEGDKSAKLCIKGRDNLIAGKFTSVRLLLKDGECWTLYTRITGESSYHEEGSYTMKYAPVHPKAQIQILCRYVKSRISVFYFDNIEASEGESEGESGGESEPSPEESSDAKLINVEQISSCELQFAFSAPVDISKASCTIKGLGDAARLFYGEDPSIVHALFPANLKGETEYYLEWNNLFDLKNGTLLDLALNIYTDNEPEKPEEPADSDAEPGELIFNELLPNPFTGGSEYIELYNRSRRPISLNGLAIATRKPDGSLNTHYPLTGTKAVVEEGGYVLLSKDVEGVKPFYFISSPAVLYEVKLPVLANTSATLVLFRKTDGVILDEASYSSKWHAASIKDPKGIALERIDPNASTQEISNWTSATAMAGYGTPGYQNSQYKKEDNPATHIEPPVLASDGLYHIRYQLNNPDYHCRSYVYDLNGRRVAEIANHQLLGLEGEVVWNGKGADSMRLFTGLYIIYIELYNYRDGQMVRYKKPFLIQ
ncbi:MAG: lamin tail domain-containing protein [Tannerellaceae bacterium]|jgi:hypothetical protein|nr:lamin tail domain-containing protein [Tannerellaceae bacterium]